MLLQRIWFAMVFFSIFLSFVTGKGGEVLPFALEGCANAIELTLQMGAGYMFFSGLMEIARGAGASKMLERRLKPVLHRLMPNQGKAAEAVGLNLCMNMLGLGNAATPKGIEAVRLMAEEEEQNPGVRQDLYMLLILNATSIQLLPTTVMTLRAAAGSADPGRIILPTLLCTAVSTSTGVLLGMVMRRRMCHAK